MIDNLPEINVSLVFCARYPENALNPHFKREGTWPSSSYQPPWQVFHVKIVSAPSSYYGVLCAVRKLCPELFASGMFLCLVWHIYFMLMKCSSRVWKRTVL